MSVPSEHTQDTQAAQRPPSVPQASTAAVTDTTQARVQSRIYAVTDWFKHAGISLDAVERFVDYWRSVGLLRGVAVAILVLTPLVKFVWLPRMASSVTTTLADFYGLDLEIDGWSGGLWDLKATGTDVVLKARGRHARPELFRADSVTVDLSFWRWLGGYGWVKNVTFDEPKLYLERTLSGRWNWEDLSSVRAGSGSFHIANLRLDDLRVEWIEHLPGQSGGGIVHSSKALLYIEDVNVLVQEVVLPSDPRDQGTRFTFNGRTADGVMSISGSANFFHWARRAAAAHQVSVARNAAAAGASPEAWTPDLRAEVYLENVGTAAIGQMLSRASLRPVTGAMTGKIQLTLHEGALTCETDLELHNVGYTANASAAVARPEVVRQALSTFRASTRVQVGCEGDRERETYRPLTALQASVTRAAFTNAPPVLQRVALLDEREAEGASEDELKALSEQLARKYGEKLAGELGGEMGAAMANSLTSKDAGNPLSRGVKGVGRGIKGLFTRDKNK